MIKANLMNKLILILGLDILFPNKFKREKFSYLPASFKEFYAREDAFDIIKAYHKKEFRREGKTLIFTMQNETVVLTDKQIDRLKFNKIAPTEVAVENKKEKVAA